MDILNRWNGCVLFSFDSYSTKLTVEAAIKAGADLYGADLRSADLSGANLYGANLRSADLRSADLRSADLSGANLRSADLRSADLYGVDLSGADLSGANLRSADLSGAKNAALFLAQTLIVPEFGAFCGFKKLLSGAIATLQIPEDAARLNAYGSRKCRASKVVCLKIEGGEAPHYDKHTGKVLYEEGKEILPDSWDDNRQEECSHGIHFFLTKLEAEAY